MAEPWQPLPRTILPLAEYARIAGINPIQFMSGEATDFFQGSGCTDRWLQYAWQGGERVSRYELAQEISRAERDIASELGWWPAPVWNTHGDNLPYPRHYRHEITGFSGLTASLRAKSVMLRWGQFVQGGQRAVTLVATATVAGGTLAYSDDDADGVYETATITLATALTNACEMGVFVAGNGGAEAFEIRPARSKTISGGVLKITMDSWLLFDPDTLAAFPGTGGFSWLDPTITGDFATSVDVYRVYNDPTTSATFQWERHPRLYTGDTYGSLTEQTGTLVAGDGAQGLVTPMPGTYDSGTWTPVAWVGEREPDRVVAYYQHGLREEQDLSGCWKVPEDLARATAYMATARIARPLCTSCENVRAWEEWLTEDLIFVQRDDATRFVPAEIINCPFGTKRGEVEAWRIVQNRIERSEKKAEVAVL